MAVFLQAMQGQGACRVMTVDVALATNPVGARRAQRWLAWLLTASLGLLAVSLLWQWLCVSTSRLYLDEARTAEASAPARARQTFVISGGRVEPQILVAEDERLAFSVDLPRPSELHLRAVPSGEATVEIALVRNGARTVIRQGRITAAAEVVQLLPAMTGLLELSNRGQLVWSDPRVLQEADYAPATFGLLAVLAVLGVAARRTLPLERRRRPRARAVFLGTLTAGISASLCLLVLELGLRATGDRLPSWITTPRRDLGEVHPDPRWQDSARYGARLTARLDTFCEWQHGDIVRLGFLAPGLARHASYRFPFVTDAEGFRNSEPDHADSVVAALGDSFTDGLTLPVELTWPARLGRLMGVKVRNYGTAGFGPGQELLVLKQHVLARRPRQVVVGFFAGNDLLDAERFETFERSGGRSLSPGLGWKFKDVIARFDRLYLTSLYQGAAGLLGHRRQDRADPWPAPGPEEYSGEVPRNPSATRPSFDRGLFTVPMAGRVLQFAFLPPYLNSLKLSREDLRSSRGWELTRQSYREMDRLVRAQGGRLVVLFIPSKAQVYLPLLEASFTRAELGQDLRLCLGGQPQPPELEVVLRNRLALNGLMREFCAEEGITFLDLTAELQSQVAAGRNVYFPDDSHWNAAGHETAARALAPLLRTQGR